MKRVLAYFDTILRTFQGNKLEKNPKNFTDIINCGKLKFFRTESKFFLIFSYILYCSQLFLNFSRFFKTFSQISI